MKNLKLLCNRNATLDQKNVKHLRLSSEQAGIAYISTEDALLSFNWQGLISNELAPIGNVIGIEHLSMNNELCVATANGDVLVYNLSTNAEESVTFCDGGIKSMAWSHDQEVVAFVTGANLLVVMNSGYDPLNESRLDDEEFGDEQFINVGWGKKETQFHGTEGKAAAKKQAVALPQVEDISTLDQSVSIVWRGDDEYFAVSFVGHNGRMFKVFDKEGRLKYTSEKCPGLEAPISWKPSGSWIAVPHVLPNKYTIALFEKNGLRHREIVLPFRNTDEQVVELLWSSDSEVLAIYTVRGDASSVYLYTIGNYHWYLKQTLRFNEHCQALLWDQNYSDGKTLHVIQANGRYSIFRWDHTVNQSNGRTIHNQAIVGVIDGSNVLLTNFRGAVIPPPMCAVTLKHSSCINQIGFLTNSGAPNDLNRFFVVDETNAFSVFACRLHVDMQRNINLLKDATLVKTYSIPIESDIPLAPHHWLWLNEQHIVFCKNEGESSIFYLCELTETSNEANVLDEITVDGLVGNVTPHGANNAIAYHLKTGEFFALAIADRKWQTPESLFDVNHFCEQIATVTVDGETRVVALKQQQNLYIDDRKVAGDVTSFLIDEHFILFTTLDQLKFIRLANEQTINERRIERGGKLIVTVPCDSRTVLQMPRGNLEAIQPRVLSLCIIGDLLDAGSYRKAFDLLRKQRINLNLLVDHNPTKFLENIKQFVTDIDNTHWLNLFLSDLQDEDVTRTMYASNYQHLKSREAGIAENIDKIDAVCESTCQMFEEIDATKFVLPIITAHVKRKNLEEALNVVWSVRIAEQKRPADAAGVVSSHEALKYLLYLVNVNELFDMALGMYDFDLVLFVAQKSQKDPKEYIPFLNELKGFEENYRKYRIDSHLKRYEKALQHIVKCGVEKLDECLELIEKENLYTQALRLFKTTDECYNDIVLQFADHLRTKGVFYDACLMYERGGDYKQALLTAKHTLDWRKCLLLAKKCSSSDDEVDQLCASLIPALQESGKFKDAAELVKRYRNNFDLYVNLLCDGRHYSDAIFEAKNHSQHSEDFVRTHLSEYANQLIDKVRADCDQFIAYSQRLQRVRKDKSDRLLNGIEDDVDNCDMFSDSSSMNSSRFTGTSKGSGKSHRSSKNRRKHERKLMSLKEGNPFEDIALVDAIYNSTHKSYSQQQHVHDILQSLIDLGLDAEGVQLQKTFETLLCTVRDSLDKVWIPEMMVSGEVKVEEIMDYVKVQNEQHYAMIKPHQRVKPLLTVIDWQFEILKS